MNKTMTLVAALILVGCQSTSNLTEIPPTSLVFGFDFREYSEKGFLFAPTGFVGDFESIGIITVTVLPGAKRQAVGGRQQIMEGRTHLGWIVGDVSPDEAIRFAYEKSIEMGADALINFTIVPKTIYIETAKLDGFDVSGFAIKRR